MERVPNAQLGAGMSYRGSRGSDDRSPMSRRRSQSPHWHRQLVQQATQKTASMQGFKLAIAVIVLYFAVKLMVEFADIVLPFVMALLLVTILEPMKQVIYSCIESTLLLFFRRLFFCSCCFRASSEGVEAREQRQPDLSSAMSRLALTLSIILTVLVAGRIFWIWGSIVWLSGEAIIHDFSYYKEGMQERAEQMKVLLKKFGLEKSVSLDMHDAGDTALTLLKYIAEYITNHAFYTATQLSLTTIFTVFLLFTPVQRKFSPVMEGVFGSMELYLKLKTYISLLMGITNGIFLGLVGFEIPAAWGLLTFLVNFIPNLGGPSISAISCLIAFVDSRKSLTQVGCGFGAQFLLHFNIANFVEPIVFGTTEAIHGVVILLGLSFFGYIWGITGMFLSVPLLFAAHSYLLIITQTKTASMEAREDARFIMGMLEGRWLADSSEGIDSAEAQEEQVVMMGTIEGIEEEGGGGGAGSSPAKSVPAHEELPVSSWQATVDCQEIWSVRDPATNDVLIPGLIMRYLLVASVCTFLIWFQPSRLIHPGGKDSGISLEAVNRTTTLARNLHTSRGA